RKGQAPAGARKAVSFASRRSGLAAELGVVFMSTRRAVPTAVLALVFASVFFGLGKYLAARQSAEAEERVAALRAEVDLLRRQERLRPAGTSGVQPRQPIDDDSRAAIVADVKRELQTEMGLLPLNLLRDRRDSFVELYSYDDKGSSNYGTAGYL